VARQRAPASEVAVQELAGLDDRISVRQADVTDLPFEDATVTLMFSQHVQVNVADKPLLYVEARRVLAADGKLALWDIVAGEDGEPDFPMPWAVWLIIRGRVRFGRQSDPSP
jgi:ubiquinone/menaquinone biosynthesis C-methylase UbiE